MTESQGYNPRSMRYQMDEVLSGMLASMSEDSFADDPAGLGETFKGLAAQYPLFAPFAAAADGKDYSTVLESALGVLVAKKWLQRVDGRYQLSEQGRISCVSNKRSLFSNADMAQLEQAAVSFGAKHAVGA